MSNQIVVSENSQKGELTAESITTLINAGIVPKDTPRSQIVIFAHVCAEKGISPFTKEIYLVGYGSKYSIITGIDGYRKIASRTGQLAGSDDPKFDLMPDGKYKTAASFGAKEMPNTCTVTIYRMISGVRCPFAHTVKFSEFSSGQQKWASMPFQMIAKVAEAFAIRKGFGDATSGIGIEEEAAAMVDAQSIVVTESKELTPDEKQKQEDAEILSQQWVDTFKDELTKFNEYVSFKDALQKILKSDKYIFVIGQDKEDFKTFATERLTELQNEQA